jgi:hypothetical protein
VLVPIEGSPVEITPERLHGMPEYTVSRTQTPRGCPTHVLRRGRLGGAQHEQVGEQTARFPERRAEPAIPTSGV